MALAVLASLSLSLCSYIVVFFVNRFIVFLIGAGNRSPSQRRCSFDILHCNAHLNTLKLFKLPTLAVPKQELPKQDVGAADVSNQQIPHMQFQEKPTANTHEKVGESSCSSNTESSCSSNHFTDVSLAIDDEVAKGATVGKIGSFKEIKGHEKRSSLVVKSKRKPKNTDLKRKVDNKVVSAEGAPQVVRSRRRKVVSADKWKSESTKAADTKPSLRKPLVPLARKPPHHADSLADSREYPRRTKFELVEPFEDPERELRRRLRERRKMYAEASDLNNPNTSKFPGPAGVLKSTQRSHTMVLRPRK